MLDTWETIQKTYLRIWMQLFLKYIHTMRPNKFWIKISSNSNLINYLPSNNGRSHFRYILFRGGCLCRFRLFSHCRNIRHGFGSTIASDSTVCSCRTRRCCRCRGCGRFSKGGRWCSGGCRCRTRVTCLPFRRLWCGICRSQRLQSGWKTLQCRPGSFLAQF